jgi:hypothetical protein
MEYMVRQVNDRFDNGFYYQQMSFADICNFFNGDDDEELDSMIQNVALLAINECYLHDFFGGNSYFFKRVS